MEMQAVPWIGSSLVVPTTRTVATAPYNETPPPARHPPRHLRPDHHICGVHDLGGWQGGAWRGILCHSATALALLNRDTPFPFDPIPIPPLAPNTHSADVSCGLLIIPPRTCHHPHACRRPRRCTRKRSIGLAPPGGPPASTPKANPTSSHQHLLCLPPPYQFTAFPPVPMPDKLKRCSLIRPFLAVHGLTW